MKKLFESGELGGAESKNPDASNSVCETWNPWSWIQILSRIGVDSSLYQLGRTTRVASEILKMNPTLRYFLSLTLKLANSKLKETLTEFLSKIILAVTTPVTWRSKFSAVFSHANYNSSRWLKLERVSDFLTKVEYPSFGRLNLNYKWL